MINYVRSLVINSSGDIFAGSNYSVFSSTDNGDNWTQINTGLTNPYVYSLTISPSGYIFVGTGGGVFRSCQPFPCSANLGDLDCDGSLFAADVVLMLNCVFFGNGNCSLGLADVNCSGDLTPADVVLELYAVFLAAPFPC